MSEKVDCLQAPPNYWRFKLFPDGWLFWGTAAGWVADTIFFSDWREDSLMHQDCRAHAIAGWLKECDRLDKEIDVICDEPLIGEEPDLFGDLRKANDMVYAWMELPT